MTWGTFSDSRSFEELELLYDSYDFHKSNITTHTLHLYAEKIKIVLEILTVIVVVGQLLMAFCFSL